MHKIATKGLDSLDSFFSSIGTVLCESSTNLTAHAMAQWGLIPWNKRDQMKCICIDTLNKGIYVTPTRTCNHISHHLKVQRMKFSGIWW